MVVKGRDKPVVGLHMDEAGNLYARIDFARQPALWVEVVVRNGDLERLRAGEALISDEAGSVPDGRLPQRAESWVMATFNEADLEELRTFIVGEGKWEFFGGATHTWPGLDDSKNAIHRMAVELERRGKIKRKFEELGHVCWVKC
jgi:hypothetical protein